MFGVTRASAYVDWQPTLTDIEVSNQRAAELARAQAVNEPFINTLRSVYSVLNDFDLSSDEARRWVLRVLHATSMDLGWG